MGALCNFSALLVKPLGKGESIGTQFFARYENGKTFQRGKTYCAAFCAPQWLYWRAQVILQAAKAAKVCNG